MTPDLERERIKASCMPFDKCAFKIRNACSPTSNIVNKFCLFKLNCRKKTLKTSRILLLNGIIPTTVLYAQMIDFKIAVSCNIPPNSWCGRLKYKKYHCRVYTYKAHIPKLKEHIKTVPSKLLTVPNSQIGQCVSHSWSFAPTTYSNRFFSTCMSNTKCN